MSNTVSKVAEAIVPSSDKGERRPQRQERERRREDVFRPGEWRCPVLWWCDTAAPTSAVRLAATPPPASCT